VASRPPQPRRPRRVPRPAHGRDLTLARGRRPANPMMTARSRRPPGRFLGLLGFPGPRPCPGPRLTGRPTARPNARPSPMAPSRTGPPRDPRPPTPRPVGCRQSLRLPRLDPGLNPTSPGPTRGPRGPRAFPAPPGCRARRGPRLPRPTSAARGRPKEARAGPRLRVPARRAPPRGSAQAAPRAVPTRVVRAARVAGRPRRGPRDLVLPGRVRPGPVDPVRARVLRVPARGRAITRSARPRPAWGRRLRLGPRVRARLVSQAVPVLRPAVRPVPPAQGVQGRQGVRVPPGAVRAVPAAQGVRVPAAQGVRVPAVPGRAR
jgi:hypothetical protein